MTREQRWTGWQNQEPQHFDGNAGTIRYHQVPSGTIRYHQVPSGTIRYHQVPSGTIRYHQVPSGTIRYHQVPSGTIRYHQVPSGTIFSGHLAVTSFAGPCDPALILKVSDWMFCGQPVAGRTFGAWAAAWRFVAAWEDMNGKSLKRFNYHC